MLAKTDKDLAKWWHKYWKENSKEHAKFKEKVKKAELFLRSL